MLGLYVGMANVLMDGGFSAALIQRREINETDKSTVFWFNLAIGIALAMLLYFAAPAIAAFYDTPALASLARGMSPLFILSSLGVIHSAVLTRQLDFRTQAKAGVVAACLSGIVAVILGLRGVGAWALAAQALVMASAMSAMLWVLHPWRPSWVFSGASFRKLFGFGGFHLGSSLMEAAYSRFYTLLIGHAFGPRELGIYANAENTRQLPGNFLGNLVARVALPMFAEAACNPQLLRRGVQLSLRGAMLINAPLMLGVAALAEPVTVLLFGKKWLPAADILLILCVAGLIYPVHMINLHALMAQGHASLMFRLELTKKVLGVILILVGASYGLMGVAWSQVVFSLSAMSINTYYTKRWLDYGALAQLRDIAPSVLIAGFVAGVAHSVSQAWDASPFLEIAAIGCVGAGAYLSLMAIARANAMREVMALLLPDDKRARRP
ncbi:lipopolysaccharide biosynthesis protein [Lysobacter olei]